MTLKEKLFSIQNEIGALTKKQDNPYFKSKYFDINQVIEHIKPLLEKNKLVVLQPLSEVNGRLALSTWVIDVEGKNEDDIKMTTILPEGLDAQKSGSAITYFRRYALQSLFLLEAQDDDANFTNNKVTFPKISKKDQADYESKVKANPNYRKPTEQKADDITTEPDFNI